MANEIALTCKATVSKTGTTITNATSTKTLDMTGLNMFHAVINVTTSLAQLETSFTGITVASNYWVLARNQDTTAAITLYLTNASTYPITVIPPGSFALVQCVGGKSIYGQAAGTPVTAENLEILVWEV
jgi:hypothetical protein